MPDILVRGLNSQTVKRLKVRAARNGRSLQREVKVVLENAAPPSIDEILEDARAWRKKLGRKFEDSTELIRQDRER